MFEWNWSLAGALIFYHIYYVVFSLYVHRRLHGNIEFNPTFGKVSRFILWLVKFYYKNWPPHYSAMHIMHHKFSDTAQDPHSPYFFTMSEFVDFNNYAPGYPWYVTPEDIDKYSSLPNNCDWIEQNIYEKYPTKGIYVLTFIFFVLYGFAGAAIGYLMTWLLIYMHTYLTVYAMHKFPLRYTNTTPPDKSVNIFPIGILLAGEELHANHHNRPNNLSNAHRWFEFDIGYWYAKLFIALGWAWVPQKR